jgi:hypothetical protein
MATKQYSVPLIGFPGKLFERYYNSSQSSPRVNGKLVLQANSHTLQHVRVSSYAAASNGRFDCSGAEGGKSYPWSSQEYNETYAKFMGRLHHGHASLGVSMASWRQSSDMIIGRFTKISKIFKRVARKRRRAGKPPARAKQLASDVLEGEFGWVPLLGDILAVTGSVFAEAIPPSWCRSSSTYVIMESATQVANPRLKTSHSGRSRITLSAKVEISNPNLWLANRLGLINPLTVAWDLVPWSFVVNMFLNVNQIIGSLSDTVGLTLSNSSVTRSSSVLTEQLATYTNQDGGFTSRCNLTTKMRERVAGTFPLPSLRFKLPDMSFNLAVIASALTIQRVKSV